MANVWTLVLALVGLGVSSYLSYSEKKHKKLVCVMGEDCNEVVKSRYGKISGVPNAYFGVPYYLIIAIISVLGIYKIVSLGEFSLSLLMIVMTTIGVVIYAGLVYIQFYKIKSWCFYCISTAVITLLILLIELDVF